MVKYNLKYKNVLKLIQNRKTCAIMSILRPPILTICGLLGERK